MVRFICAHPVAWMVFTGAIYLPVYYLPWQQMFTAWAAMTLLRIGAGWFVRRYDRREAAATAYDQGADDAAREIIQNAHSGLQHAVYYGETDRRLR